MHFESCEVKGKVVSKFQDLDLVLLVVVNVVLAGFFLSRFYAPWAKERATWYLSPSSDPSLGMALPDPLRPFLTEKPLLVVAYGQCSECTLRNLESWVMMLERWRDEVEGVIVVQEKKATIQKLAQERGWKVPFVADEGGVLLRVLNAYFLPRAYGFSPDGRLVWKQERFGMDELRVIREVVETVKGKAYAHKVFNRKPAWAHALEDKPSEGERKGGAR